MLKYTQAQIGFVLGLIVLSASSTARADDDDCHSSCAEGDLESLSARLDWTGTDWCLSIRYEIELEDVHPRDAFDLVLTPLDCGRELADSSGAAVRWSVPLEFRAYCDDDDVEFKDEVSMRLSPEVIGDPFRLRICGELVCRESGKVLDAETACVKVCRLPPPVVECVEVREKPVVVCPPPPPVVVCPPPPPPPPVVIYRPRPVVIYRPYVPCRPYYECRPRWRRGFVHVDVDW